MSGLGSWACLWASADRVAVTTITHSLVTGAIVFVGALLASVVLTALVRHYAPRLGLIDCPDNHRKLHPRSVPLGGGIAVYGASVLVLGLLLVVPNIWQGILARAQNDLFALGVAGGVIVLVGLIDDRVRLRGRLKLIGQIVAASMLMVSGLVIQGISIFGFDIDLGLLAVPFTLFWLLGAVNAMNLLDGIDGLASMLGFILVCTIAAMGMLVGHWAVMIIALVFAGSLLGFLRFNFPPASIFLGDAGSMLIGLMVGALAIRGSLKGPGTVLLAAPLAVWTVPILDSLAAILRRKLTGRSIYASDRGHLHHRLMDLLGSNRKVLACVAIVCALTSAATLFSVYLKEDLVALLACSSIVIMLIATGLFGRAEVLLLTSQMRKFGRSLFEPADGNRARIAQTSVRLQGTRRWESLWSILADEAEHLGLTEIRLDVNLPWLHEGYHASWEWPWADDFQPRWRLEIPLVVSGQRVGSLIVVGQQNGAAASAHINDLLAVLEPFERKLQHLSEEIPVQVPAGDLAMGPLVGKAFSGLARSHPK